MPTTDPLIVLPATSPPLVLAPRQTPPLVIGPVQGVVGTGTPGDLAVWQTAQTQTGYAGLTWDATNAELDASGPGTNNATVYAEATAVGGVALWGEGGHGSNGAGVTGRGMAASSYGVEGITTAGVGVRGRATATSGIGVQAATTDAAGIPLQGTAPSGQTADLLQLLVNSGLVFAVGAAGYLQLYQAAAPGNPPSGSVRLYLDSADGHVKIKKSSGTVIDLG
jgi:hypothetical protein